MSALQRLCGGRFLLLVLLALGTVLPGALATPKVFCADEPEAAEFMAAIPERFTAGALSREDSLFESWLSSLPKDKMPLPIIKGAWSLDSYVEHSTIAPKPAGWDGTPIAFKAVILVQGDGTPTAVLILAASHRGFAKAVAADFLRWTFKQRLGKEMLRPGIYREVSVPALL